MNFGNATNLGVEVDIMKYFNWFGIKANYTYTHSSITTDKRIMEGNDVKSVSQQSAIRTGSSCSQFIITLQEYQIWLGKPARRKLYRKTSKRYFQLV